MPGKIEMVGRKFNRLLVLSEAYKVDGGYFYHCKCDCGNEATINGMKLRSGHTKSCGCLHKEVMIKRNTTHGLYFTAEHRSWEAMLKRCYYKENVGYKNYGEKGITVCKRWRESFQCFFDDMGYKPSIKHTLDRIDNSDGYYKENCRWATRVEQSLNRSDNHRLTFNSKTQTIKEWSDEVGIKMSTICNRINIFGWSVDRALTEIPIDYKNKKNKI